MTHPSEHLEGTPLIAPSTIEHPLYEQVVEASKLVPDDIVQMICAAGTPDECREKVDEYIATGCTCPILYPLGDVNLMIDTFATRGA